MVRTSLAVGFATAMSVGWLHAQDPAATNARPIAKWTDKDRLAEEGNKHHRGMMGVVVRLVPLSNVTYRSSVLGRQVQAEGVAFRGHVFMDSSNIRIKGNRFDLDDDEFRGRLVRVIGKLRYSHGSQSKFGNTPPYFYIDPEECELVDRVNWPSLTISDDDLIPVVSISKGQSGE